MKILCWNCRGIGNPATIHELKQILVANDPEVIFLCETKVQTNKFPQIRSKCRMEGCLAVNACGKSSGLVMMWKEGTKVEIQSYSCNHILIHDENDKLIRFTRFYGNADPNNRKSSWDMLKGVGRSVKEKWIIGGDFNAILDNSKKEGGRRKPQALMDDFREVIDELSLVDLKTDNGWFTWVNNRKGSTIVKERLDLFFDLGKCVHSFPFIETKVIRQSNSDHDAIMLDTKGRKPGEEKKDGRLMFRYDICWAKETEAKNIIKNAWKMDTEDIMDKIEKVELGSLIGTRG
ncbi:uncharacterized protein LOC128293787 [Gossypium arboreum]|uniref:Endonuclease/exonuclease/phosphatase domain-containing protein n=1 Tax=Gossypium arboreum TaxID=29729 RepID=A0ABR0PMS9_GOSAR|nr:uncharacterized protein LOC128293787 [Gossypium arboreum]KAK5825742.1 hypothetical protein PVK06_020606 [Gossypium arboreum]